ncbi:MAG: glycosyltransferase, partial [Chlamydiales bacterium]
LTLYGQDSNTPQRQKICLNRIVKDESKIIRRCLDSVKPFIDYWVIVDTGSSDGTQKIIKQHMKGVPGELHQRKWKNWGETRTEALTLAKGKGDYLLFMDADDLLEFDPDFERPIFTADLYHMWRGTKDFSYLKPQIVKASLPWKWVGVTHEYLGCDKPYTSETLEHVKYVSIDDGATRSLGVEKYWKNVKLLEEGLKKEPNNERYAFYLAESYRDAGEKGKALEWFQKRINMGGWAEEIFWARLQIALLLHGMGLPPSVVIESYLNAHNFRPHRIEPIYYLAQLYNEQGEHKKAYQLIKKRELMEQPSQKDSLFNMDWMEEYGLLFQLSISSYFVGNYQESLNACDKLLQIERLPESWRMQTVTNRTYPLNKLQASPD